MSELYTRDSIEIEASPTAVWRTLTEPALTRLYLFGCAAVSDWKPGSRLDWRGSWEGEERVFVTGRVVTWEPGRLLQYTTFDPHGGLEDRPENHVTLTARLTPRGGGTLLELSQGDFAKVEGGERRFRDASQGSDGLLEKLKRVAESLAG
jgi:uncharacterized protein YndB with AHSA1/START domain